MESARTLLADYLPAAVAFAAFAVLHSAGAREPLKRWLARVAGEFFVAHFWRTVYCGASIGALYWGIASLLWARLPDNDAWLFIYPAWAWTGITLVHLGSVVLLYAAFLQSDYLEFLGLRQAWRGVLALAGRPQPPLPLFGTDRLVTVGLYRWVRHPMLSAGLLFLLTSGPTLNNLVYTALYAAYMVVGAWYEEKRLVRIFGQAYLDYRRRVGAFLPRPSRLPGG
ncbi:MAG: isoprenylcysteine carboxylmethyltransferase family protein [Betaproteobacteria bacterium]|nr:isoprenylcysteine carboxylmethyltransferase family protein [Betaproteobacteria bacterium]